MGTRTPRLRGAHGAIDVAGVSQFVDWSPVAMMFESGAGGALACSRTLSGREQCPLHLEEFLDDLVGSSSARESVRTHLRRASAVVGMQILMSVYDDAV
jgi:hypothetical protein